MGKVFSVREDIKILWEEMKIPFAETLNHAVLGRIMAKLAFGKSLHSHLIAGYWTIGQCDYFHCALGNNRVMGRE